MFAELNEPEKALTDYEQAISFGLQDGDVFYNRGFLHRKLENIPQCQKDLKTAMNLFRKEGNNQMYEKAPQQNLQQNTCTEI